MIEGAVLALLTLLLLALLRHYTQRLSPDGRVPVERGWLPYIGCAFQLAASPRQFFERLRQRHGDSFVVYVFGVKLFCTFSPQGVSSLYRLREKDASFTQATKGLLGLKLPAEVLAEDSLVKFHRGLKPRLLPFYVRYAVQAVNAGLAAMPAAGGSFSIFPTVKGLVHRVGLACWIGPIANNEKYFSQVVAAYEQLDPESAFSDLNSVMYTQLTGKYQERRALDTLTGLVQQMKADLDKLEPRVVEIAAAGEEDDDGIRDNLSNLYALHSQEPARTRDRKVALDVFHFILASQANLYAGISWCLIHLLTKDETHLQTVMKEIAAVKDRHGDEFLSNLQALDELVYLEAVIYETLRLVQQSITLRKVMEPCVLETERGPVSLQPSWYVATLLSVTNMDEKHNTLGDLTDFKPSRYLGPDGTGPVMLRLTGTMSKEVETLTSTFGHFAHACPGRKMAVAVSKVTLVSLLSRFKLTPQFTAAHVPPTSFGALARVSEPCIVDFERL